MVIVERKGEGVEEGVEEAADELPATLTRIKKSNTEIAFIVMGFRGSGRDNY